jgi:hypothetical protein
MAHTLFTMPIEKPELRCLKLAATKTDTTMAALVRRGIVSVLNEVSPEEAETWESMQLKRAGRSRSAAK